MGVVWMEPVTLRIEWEQRKEMGMHDSYDAVKRHAIGSLEGLFALLESDYQAQLRLDLMEIWVLDPNGESDPDEPEHYNVLQINPGRHLIGWYVLDDDGLNYSKTDSSWEPSLEGVDAWVTDWVNSLEEFAGFRLPDKRVSDDPEPSLE